MGYENILVEIDAPIATLTLNRPKVLNALSPDLIRELTSALADLDADESVRAVVLTGGPKVFAAGAAIRDNAEPGSVPQVARRPRRRSRSGWRRRLCSRPLRGRWPKASPPSARAFTFCSRAKIRRKGCTRSSRKERACSGGNEERKRWRLRSSST